MTLVEVLCLNHRLASGINGTPDRNGPGMFETCMSAGHRMFHFYGGIQDPTPYAWMHPMTSFEEIEESVKAGKYTPSEYRLNIDLFLDTWKQLASNDFTPEWFLFIPEAFFGTDSIETNVAPQKRTLTEIADVLTIYERTKVKDPIQKNIHEKDNARERKQAYCDMQRVDRKGEGDYLTYLRKWQKSQNTEQRWLGVMSMSHYLRSGLADFDSFYDWLKKSLADKYYLIRSETLDMLQSLVVANPSMNLILADRLNNEKTFALQITAFEVMRRLIQPESYYGHRYFEQFKGLQNSLDSRSYNQFSKVCKKVGINLVKWIEKLQSINSLFSQYEISEDDKSNLMQGVEELSPAKFSNYIASMNRILGGIRLTKGHFRLE
jgi:hypothetical protein